MVFWPGVISTLGQLGSGLAPEDSWQKRLGMASSGLMAGPIAQNYWNEMQKQIWSAPGPQPEQQPAQQPQPKQEAPPAPIQVSNPFGGGQTGQPRLVAQTNQPSTQDEMMKWFYSSPFGPSPIAMAPQAAIGLTPEHVMGLQRTGLEQRDQEMRRQYQDALIQRWRGDEGKKNWDLQWLPTADGRWEEEYTTSINPDGTVSRVPTGTRRPIEQKGGRKVVGSTSGVDPRTGQPVTRFWIQAENGQMTYEDRPGLQQPQEFKGPVTWNEYVGDKTIQHIVDPRTGEHRTNESPRWESSTERPTRYNADQLGRELQRIQEAVNAEEKRILAEDDQRSVRGWDRENRMRELVAQRNQLIPGLWDYVYGLSESEKEAEQGRKELPPGYSLTREGVVVPNAIYDPTMFGWGDQGASAVRGYRAKDGSIITPQEIQQTAQDRGITESQVLSELKKRGIIE